MGSFEVRWRKSSLADIKKVAKADRDASRRIRENIAALADTPFPPNSLKLRTAAVYRLRIGSYRVFYTLDGQERVITIEEISPRPQAYRKR